MGRFRPGFAIGLVCVAAVAVAGCRSPAWKQDLAAELAAAKERWSEASAHEISYSVRQINCGGCDASALDQVVTVEWSDGRASTTGPTDAAEYVPAELFGLAEVAIEHAAAEDDVALAFDDATGLPTRIDSTWDAADDGDFAFSIEVTAVQ